LKEFEEKELSYREEEVLRLLLKGLFQKQVADILDISESRIQSIYSTVKKKWGAKTQIELFLMALEKGYLDDRIDKISSLNGFSIDSTTGVRVIYKYVE